jgi:hypothetical protein
MVTKASFAMNPLPKSSRDDQAPSPHSHTDQLRALLKNLFDQSHKPDEEVANKLVTMIVKSDDGKNKVDEPIMSALLGLLKDPDPNVRKAALWTWARTVLRLRAGEQAIRVLAMRDASEKSPNLDFTILVSFALRSIAKADTEILSNNLKLLPRLQPEDEREWKQLYEALGGFGFTALMEQGYHPLSEREQQARANNVERERLEREFPTSQFLMLDRLHREEFIERNGGNVAPQLPLTFTERKKQELLRDEIQLDLMAPFAEQHSPTPGRLQARAARSGRNRFLIRLSRKASITTPEGVTDSEAENDDSVVMKMSNEAVTRLLADGQLLQASLILTELSTMTEFPDRLIPSVANSLVTTTNMLRLDAESRHENAGSNVKADVARIVEYWAKLSSMRPERFDLRNASFAANYGATGIYLRLKDYTRCVQAAQTALDILDSVKASESPLAANLLLQAAQARLGQERHDLALEFALKADVLVRNKPGCEWQLIECIVVNSEIKAASEGACKSVEWISEERLKLANSPGAESQLILLDEQIVRLHLFATKVEEAVEQSSRLLERARKQGVRHQLLTKLILLDAEVSVAVKRLDQAKRDLTEVEKRLSDSDENEKTTVAKLKQLKIQLGL